MIRPRAKAALLPALLLPLLLPPAPTRDRAPERVLIRLADAGPRESLLRGALALPTLDARHEQVVRGLQAIHAASLAEARGILDGGFECQAHDRARARYGHRSPANLNLAALREMPIERHVLSAHDVAGFERWLDRNPQLWFVPEEDFDFRSKGAAMHLAELQPIYLQ